MKNNRIRIKGEGEVDNLRKLGILLLLVTVLLFSCKNKEVDTPISLEPAIHEEANVLDKTPNDIVEETIDTDELNHNTNEDVGVDKIETENDTTITETLNIIEFSTPELDSYNKAWIMDSENIYVGSDENDGKSYRVGKLNYRTYESSWSILEMESKEYGNSHMKLLPSGNLMISFNNIAYEYNVITEEFKEIIHIENAVSMDCFDENNYVYTNTNYELILHRNGINTLIYAGYYEDGVGGLGIFGSIPADIRMSKDGNYISFYKRGYEWSYGPYVCDKNGSIIFSGLKYGNEFSKGYWVDESRYIQFNTDAFERVEEVEHTFWIYDFDKKTGNGFNDVVYSGEEDNIYDCRFYQSDAYANWDETPFFIENSIKYSFDYSGSTIQMIATDYSIESKDNFDGSIVKLDYYSDYFPFSRGNKLNLKTTVDGIDIFRETTYSDYNFIGSFTKEELNNRLVDSDYFWDEQILNIDNRVIIDYNSGNVLEENKLVGFLNTDSFEIISVDYNKTYLAYLVKSEQASEFNYKILLKKSVSDDFRLISEFTTSNDYRTGELTVMLDQHNKLYYDYLENEQMNIYAYSDSGNTILVKENAKNIRYQNRQYLNEYFDIGLNKYVYFANLDLPDNISKDQSRLLNVIAPEIEDSKLWIKTKKDGSRELNVIVKFYNSEPLDKTIALKDDILIDANIYFELLRLEYLHIDTDGNVESIIENIDLLEINE